MRSKNSGYTRSEKCGPYSGRWLTLLVVILGLCVRASGAETDGPATRNSGSSHVTLSLAADRRALLPIVISDKASDRTKAVAAELADYLRRMTGVTFEVRTGDGSAGIVLGTLAEFPYPSLDEPLAIRGRFDGREAYAIRTEPGRLVLIGATDLGASHAAFRFLEHLGCRWFFPAPEWEVVPSVPDLRISANETDRPTLLARRIWYGWGFFHDPGEAAPGRAVRDYQVWARHNRMAGSFAVNAGHAWQTIIAQNKAEFDRHPEYLALVKGERTGEQFCVSNPAVRRIAVDYALDFLRKHPEADMVSMETSDGGGHCECEECGTDPMEHDRARFASRDDVPRRSRWALVASA